MVGISRLSHITATENGILATHSPLKFAEIYRDRTGHDEAIFEYGDVPYYSYVSNKGYRYIPTFYRTPYAYFIITFISQEGGEWGVEEILTLTRKVFLKLD